MQEISQPAISTMEFSIDAESDKVVVKIIDSTTAGISAADPHGGDAGPGQGTGPFKRPVVEHESLTGLRGQNLTNSTKREADMGITAPGMGSNLDVNSIVSQLMAVERQPLALLDRREADYKAKLSAYGTLKGALAAFQTAMQGLADPARFQAATSQRGRYFHTDCYR